jgi:hypothetical protein
MLCVYEYEINNTGAPGARGPVGNPKAGIIGPELLEPRGKVV